MSEKGLIVIKQLPVIEDQLLSVKTSIEGRVNAALSLVCTEDTYKQIKKVRADLNKEYQELEQRRKEIKAEILKPYQDFEGVYKECAGDIYAKADRELAQKIGEVESGLKQQKQEDLEQYFGEYRTSLNIPEGFVEITASGIKVGLSDSRKSLHEKVAQFLDRIRNDLDVMKTLEHREEVLVEYRKNGFNLSGAMLTVDNRHKLIEAERARNEAQRAAEEEAKKAAEAVKQVVQEDAPVAAAPIAAPVATPVSVPAAAPVDNDVTEPVTYTCTFTVRATREKLIDLKKFLEDGGYDYE